MHSWVSLVGYKGSTEKIPERFIIQTFFGESVGYNSLFSIEVK